MTLKLVVSRQQRENTRIVAEAAERNRIDKILAKTDAQQKLHDLVAQIKKGLEGGRGDGIISITLEISSDNKEGRPLAKKSIPTHAAFH